MILRFNDHNDKFMGVQNIRLTRQPARPATNLPALCESLS